MATTFKTLRKKVDAMGDIIIGTLADKLDDVLDRARINADDTVYVEKAQSVAQWNKIAYASIQDILSRSDTDEQAVRWFEKNGVSF